MSRNFIEEYERQFGRIADRAIYSHQGTKPEYDNVKTLLKTALREQRDEMIKEIENCRNYYFDELYDGYDTRKIDDFLNKLSGQMNKDKEK